MKLSTRGRYGTRVLLDLALHRDQKIISLKDVSEREQIPLAYLKRLISPLVAAGLIWSTRGSGGGVSLAKSPENIRLTEIIELLEGPLTLTDCASQPESCERSGSCAPRDVWRDMGDAMRSVLESITLRDLVERQRNKTQTAAHMYNI